MPSKTWGTRVKIERIEETSLNDEIPKGERLILLNKQPDIQTPWWVYAHEWEAFMNGDLSQIKNEVERQIKGAKVEWIQLKWDKADPLESPIKKRIVQYNVYGLSVEVIVKNESASLTGLEIVLIIGLIGVFATVFTILGMTVWTAGKVVMSATEMGAPVVVGVGLILVIIFVVAILLIFGVKIEKAPRRVKIGK